MHPGVDHTALGHRLEFLKSYSWADGCNDYSEPWWRTNHRSSAISPELLDIQAATSIIFPMIPATINWAIQNMFISGFFKYDLQREKHDWNEPTQGHGETCDEWQLKSWDRSLVPGSEEALLSIRELLILTFTWMYGAWATKFALLELEL